MGMSASQARLLNLEARQSNLEYQGQQINQERSVLSQQCTALYNSLLAMSVPTPPSTSDYTKVEYKGVDGATTLTIGNVKPHGENYTVELKTQSVGKAMEKNYGSYAVGTAGKDIQGTKITTSQVPTVFTANKMSGEAQEGHQYINVNAKKEAGAQLLDKKDIDPSNYVEFDANTQTYKKVYNFVEGKEYVELVNIENVKNNEDFLELQSNGTVGDAHTRLIKKGDNASIYDNGEIREINEDWFDKNGYLKQDFYSNNTFFIADKDGADTVRNPKEGKTTIGGNVVYTYKEAKEQYPNYDWNQYAQAIKNTFGEDSTKNDISQYYIFESGEGNSKKLEFSLKADINTLDNFAETYSFSANGKFTQSEEIDGCKLEFDANGMITKISIPKYNPENPVKPVSYNHIELSAEKVTDDKAYKDAYAKYEFATYEYDKKNQEINAKTEVIQQQDRNLELKLQRLDNERTQIKTEIEAVKKVINDNIEGSYKTFSG